MVLFCIFLVTNDNHVFCVVSVQAFLLPVFNCFKKILLESHMIFKINIGYKSFTRYVFGEYFLLIGYVLLIFLMLLLLEEIKKNIL